MVVKPDGTKWACASCLKGHRVSGCTHVDRELTFVPKKGRPVTQCPHCRSERKKRSAHVKCDCGEKPHPKEKCIHLRQAEAMAAVAAANAAGNTSTNDSTPDPAEHHASALEPISSAEDFNDDHHCCCPHGGKCTCATLCKDSPEPSSPPKLSHPKPKPHLVSHKSEGHLTVFANGHHKPVHRNNKAAHECGVPYKISRTHPTHGVADIARRSVESLASIQSMSPISWQPPGSIGTITASQEHPNAQSERGSPQSDHSTSHQSPFDLNISLDTTSFTAPEPSSSVASTIFQDFGFPSTQSALSITTNSTDASMSAFSMATSALDFDNNPADPFWSNVDWARLDSGNVEKQPALTNASSGTISEIDDPPPAGDPSGFDAQYSIDGRTQMSRLEYCNDFSDNSNFVGDYNASSNSSDRWSMPVFPTQGGTVGFTPLADATCAKDMPIQSFGIAQPAKHNQPTMSSGAKSAQSQSPAIQAPDNMYQCKEGGLENFDWESLMPDYGTAAVAGNDTVGDSLGFAVSRSTQPAVGATTANEVQGSGGFGGFNNSYRTMMQWDDGMSIPVDQEDYVDNFNFDPNWPTASFNNPWS